MKEYNWSEDWEVENRFMNAINQWGELCHVMEERLEDEDGEDESDLDECR
jgi:hypothetical protein